MTNRIAGCDLGKASVSFALGTVGEAGEVVVEDSRYRLHEDNPLELIRRWSFAGHFLDRRAQAGLLGGIDLLQDAGGGFTRIGL